MSDAERYKLTSFDEPAPCFATEAEIDVADRLRHLLEERYLGLPQPAVSSEASPGEGHGR